MLKSYLFISMKELFNLIIDKRCPICQSESSFLDCLDCLSKLHDTLEAKYESICYKNATLSVTFCNYKKIKKIIEAGKYKLNDDVFLAIASVMNNQLSFAKDTVITFIPSSFKVDQQKGYNPAYEIAKNIAKSKQLPIFGLMGANQQSSQVKLSRQERIENVKNKFFLKTPVDLSAYKVCVIVDDVITSGATMMAASDLISEAYPHLSLIWLAPCKS